MVLRFNNVSKRYTGGPRTIVALDDVSLELDAGQFAAVSGPSGCGKSTLLLAAGALLRPDEGSITVCGEDPYALSAEARARFRAANIGFVFQQFHLIPYLTVRANVLAASIALPADGAAARADELIEHFGLADRADHTPARLSTGERQRVALARALLNQPELILADEPTGNLDGANAERVLGYLAEFAACGGAVLLVTHDQRAAGYAQQSLAMDCGKISPQHESAGA